ncbi:helix-turn-helix domain-containing protein [Streptomyces roseifaciens]
MTTDTTPPAPGQDDAPGVRKRHPRRRGAEREALRQTLKERYDAGESIRALADAFDLSYGLTHTLLREARVKFRNHRGRRPARKAADQ